MEAISHAGTAVGVLATDGVVLAAEKKVTSKLLEQTGIADKMYKIDDHVATVVAGITADANILINNARTSAQRYLFQYQEPTPVEGINFRCFWSHLVKGWFNLSAILSKVTHNLVVSGLLEFLF